MRSSHCISAVVVVLLAVFVPSAVDGFYFFVPVEGLSCFSQEAPPEASTVTAHYSTGLGSGVLKVTVTDPKRVKILEQDISTFGTEGSFHFNTAEMGRFDICLKYTGGAQPLQMSLDIVEAVDKDYRDPNVPLTDYAMRSERVRVVVQQGEDEMSYLETRQAEFDQTVGSTYVRVIVITVVQVLLVVGIVAWQVLHLRNYFKQKKLV